MKIRSLIFAVSLILSSVNLSGQNTTGYMKASLGPKERLVLNTVGNLKTIQVELKNISDHDQEIIKELPLTIPSHLYAIELVINTDGSQKKIARSYLLFPGDTILIDKKADTYLDKLLDINAGYYTNNDPILNEKLKSEGLRSVIEGLNARFIKNEQRIKETQSDPHKKAAFSDLNYILKVSQIVKIPFEKLDQKDLVLMDAVQKGLISDLLRIQKINSQLNYSIYYSIIRYNAFRKGNLQKNYWDFYNSADLSIKKMPFFGDYLFVQLNLINNTKPELTKQYAQQLKDFGINPGKVDSFYRSLTNPLSEEKFDLAILSEIASLPLLENVAGDKVSLKSIIKQQSSKFTIIDFWASWCVPCRAESPLFDELKSKYKNIAFVKISLDDNDQVAAWKKAVSARKSKITADQYRILNVKSSEIAKRLKLTSIPRYVVLNANAEVIVIDAPRPSDPRITVLLNSLSSQ